MARKPVVGSDYNIWGSILNNYLDVGHETDGYVKPSLIARNVPLDSTCAAGDVVYWDSTSTLIKKAISDGTDRANAIGMVQDFTTDSTSVVLFGLCDTSSVTTVGVQYYLSDTTSGKITTDRTAIPVGKGFSNNKLIVNFGGSGSSGDATLEDSTYEILLASLPFASVYYDTFSVPNTVTLDGSPLPIYTSSTTSYLGDTSSIIISPEVLPDTTTTYYKFLLHADRDSTNFIITSSYSRDGGSIWNSCNQDAVVTDSSGFTSLKVKMQWGGTGSLNSYGVFYREENNSYATDTRMFEKYVFDTSHIAPYQTTLPNNAYYTVDGKSLEVYLNRQRLTIDTDYEEVNSRTINYLINTATNDEVIYTEKFGYIDNSVNNQNTLTALLRKVPNTLRYVSSDTSAAAGDSIRVNSSASSFNIVLPPAPSDGDAVEIIDVKGTFDTSNVTVIRSGRKIMGLSENMILDTENSAPIFTYEVNNDDWRIK